ncbi:hypothetical protein E0Z10_g6281 [Xylaria hypoxylon]|uniref:Uncharacterized protein n=1 Tax=Xylaria hypoxylon TaxID=37992 RepID=A0A4Z0YEN0_9PEZI|nr:hypothetical protein E0Z10_g6281 [Xylaria hypoxylon]
MMDNLKAVDVQDEGFWQGLDSRAACAVFLPEKYLPANETESCSLDYDVLFGAAFPNTSSDPDSATAEDQNSPGRSSVTSPTGDTASDTTGKTAYSGHADDCASATAVALTIPALSRAPSDPTSTGTELEITRHLSADDKADGALPGWVAHLLTQTHDTFTIMRTWCSFLQKQMSTAKTAEEQLLTRSLILQGARIIKSFYTSSVMAPAEAYMVLDIGAWDKLAEGCREPRSNLTRIPQFAAYTEAKTRLIQLLESSSDSAADLYGIIFSQQAEYFYSTQTEPKLFRYPKDCITLAEIRLHIISCSFVPAKTAALLQHSQP